ncbi:nuclear transport factor 2 family protein [bacterium]|nr:nuclear transport factor 2 family protein [bacterium]
MPRLTPPTRTRTSLAPTHKPAFSRSLRVSASAHRPTARASATEVSAETTVRAMYDAINRRDVEAALKFVADDILYEDFNFPTPFKGKAAVRKLFEESCDGIPDDMLFIIDECTDGGGIGVGMTWYVELEGESFPNARGASFYRVDPVSGLLVYARDVVEPPAKLGDLSFSIIRAVAPLVKTQLRQQREKREAEGGVIKGDTSTESSSSSSEIVSSPGDPLAAAGLAALGAAYWFVLLLSPPGWQGLPGEPAWAVAPETLHEVIAESTDFFFVLPLLNDFGIDLLGKAPQVHPVTLGVFNFAEAFIFMLLPLLMMDKQRRGNDLPTEKVWSVAMFLTNAAMLPYFAARAAAGKSEKNIETEQSGLAETTVGTKGLLSKAFGVSGLAVGVLSVWWALCAVPEVGGDFSDRMSYLGGLMSSDRVSLAFVVDIALFSVWQAYLIGDLDKDAPAACKYVPFWGLAAWLVL